MVQGWGGKILLHFFYFLFDILPKRLPQMFAIIYRSWVSRHFIKVGDKVQKLIQFYDNFSCNVFVKSGGVGQKCMFYFSIYCYYKRFLNDFINNRTVRTHRASKHNFFDILYFVFEANFLPKTIIYPVTCKTPFYFNKLIILAYTEARNTKKNFKICFDVILCSIKRF